MNRFVIPDRLPGLNDLIAANRRSKYQGARMKRDAEALIRFAIRQAVRRGDCFPTGDAPVLVRFEFQERTQRRDLDNIFSGKKFILDAMQREGIIKNDGQKVVRGFVDSFALGSDDRITVCIEIIGKKGE